MSRLYIVGAGGHGAVVAETANVLGRWSEIRFVDERIPESGDVLGWRVVKPTDPSVTYAEPKTEIVVAIGDNSARIDVAVDIRSRGGRIVSLIHPAAVVSPSAVIAAGTVVFANAVVNARTSIGAACIINTAATVDHDCVLSDGVHVSPGANIAGGVTIGERAWIGLGASVKHGLSIGRDARIGAGAAVIADVAADSTVVGVPARDLDSHVEH